MFGQLLSSLGSAFGGSASSSSPSVPMSPPASPSFGSQVGSSIKDGVASGIGALPGQALNAAVGSKFAGRAHKNFQDGAFPGTTPFDRLSGSNGSSGSAGGPSDAVRVAKIQARSADNVARINSTAPLSRERRESSAGIASAQGEKLRSESSLNVTRRLLEQARLPREVINSRAAKEFAAADLTAAQSKTVINAAANLIRRSNGMTPEKASSLLNRYGDAIADRVLSLYRAYLDSSIGPGRTRPYLPPSKPSSR